MYLRNADACKRAWDVSVGVVPEFHEDASSRAKQQLEIAVSLVAISPWVAAPKHLLLMNGGVCVCV